MNLNFKKPTIDDKEWVQNILNREKKINSESAFGTCYLWADYFSTQICNYEGMLIKKSGKETTSYECPKGALSAQDFKKAMDAVINDAKENGYDELILTDFLDSEVQKTEEAFPGKFEFAPVRDDFEYIYKTKSLALLQGKKYHGKRNHISKFSKMFNWEYKPIIPEFKDKYLMNHLQPGASFMSEYTITID